MILKLKKTFGHYIIKKKQYEKHFYRDLNCIINDNLKSVDI